MPGATREPRCSSPDTPDVATQVVHVRDLAGWLLASAGLDTSGRYNALGPVVPFGEWVALSRAAGGHTGPVVPVVADWLVEHGVEQFMDEDSLAMWSVDPADAGWSARSGAAAQAAGLQHRPREASLQGVLTWEREQGLDRPRAAGLRASRERELLSTLAHAG